MLVPRVPEVGHAAMLIGNDRTGWRYFSFEGLGRGAKPALDELRFKTVQEAQNAKALASYTHYALFITNEKSDQVAIRVGESFRKKKFAIGDRNCQTVAVAILAAATTNQELVGDLKVLPPETYKAIQAKASLRGLWKFDIIPPGYVNKFSAATRNAIGATFGAAVGFAPIPSSSLAVPAALLLEQQRLWKNNRSLYPRQGGVNR
jgi:hypothetical protein